MNKANTFIRYIGYFLVHLFTAIGLYVTALCFTSPVYNIVITVLDYAGKFEVMAGKYLLYWLISSTVLWVFLFVYTEVKAHKKTKTENK